MTDAMNVTEVVAAIARCAARLAMVMLPFLIACSGADGAGNDGDEADGGAQDAAPYPTRAG